ncbi:hypothetical protein BC941DRAFT_468038 [Chlamydoabsidia padenii]|nr:hypothetical protein BC941DRAFT_468038 [Chlamydoabsidia padenii]
MPPIVLKVKGNKSFFPFSNLDSEEDLSKTWRVCTKVKDSLENGSRLENLSWRLWYFNDKCNNGAFQSLSRTTALKLDHHPVKIRPLKNKKKKKNNISNTTSELSATTPSAMVMPQEELVPSSTVYPPNQQQNMSNRGLEQTLVQLQQQSSSSTPSSPSSYLTKQPLMIDTSHTTNHYMLNQYTSNQNNNDSPMVELDHLFGVAFDHGDDSGGLLQQAENATDLMMDDSNWISGPPSSAPGTSSFDNNFTSTTPGYQLPIQTTSSISGFHYHHQPSPQRYTSSPSIVNNYNMSLSMPSSPSSYLPHHHSATSTTNDAMYVSSSSTMPLSLPTGTLGIKLYANHGLNPQSVEDHHHHHHQQQQQQSNGDDFSLGSTNCNITATTVVTPMTDTDSANHQHPLAATTTTPSHTPPSKSTHTAPEIADPVCTNCGATSTPLWRRSFEDEVLCNACGLYEKLHNAPRPKSLKPHNTRKEIKEEEVVQLVCSNCSTTTTPLWRRDDGGASLCNACGLYFKLHHERRPLSMKTDIIKKRQRYESSNSNHPNGRRAHHKKMKNETIANPVTVQTSSSSSTSSHSSPPSPAMTIGNQLPTVTATNIKDDEYQMIHDIYPVSASSSPSTPTSTSPSSPTGHTMLPYNFLQQQHPSPFMYSG